MAAARCACLAQGDLAPLACGMTTGLRHLATSKKRNPPRHNSVHGRDSRSLNCLICGDLQGHSAGEERDVHRMRATSTQNESSRGHVDSIAATGLRVSRSRRLRAQVAGRLDPTGADGSGLVTTGSRFMLDRMAETHHRPMAADANCAPNVRRTDQRTSPTTRMTAPPSSRVSPRRPSGRSNWNGHRRRGAGPCRSLRQVDCCRYRYRRVIRALIPPKKSPLTSSPTTLPTMSS
jgi:hypothetical protein